MSPKLPRYTVPSLTPEQGAEVAEILQQRLHALNDLHLTLKHVHWNVVGPHFIGVHEMLDPQVDAVRAMVDQIAERIATLGVVPVGTPGALVASRTWDDYALGRAPAIQHLAALLTGWRRDATVLGATGLLGALAMLASGVTTTTAVLLAALALVGIVLLALATGRPSREDGAT